MRNPGFVVLALFFVIVGNIYAQVPLVGPPVHLDLGVGGGVSLPVGRLSDVDNTGWHAGAKARFSALIPINIVGSVNYNRLPLKPPSDGELDVAWMIGAGIEYPIPGILVKPYLGLDGSVNLLSNTASGASTREGLGVGAGVEFSVPAFGSFDASVKYHMLNLMGKESGEETLSQVTASVSIMFSVL